jgi:3-carboxy-cis,cis-muconate cycloisomerase
MDSPYSQIFYSGKFLTIFSTENLIRTMLFVETELAKAQASHGLIPSSAAMDIEQACHLDEIKIDLLVREAGSGANLVIPLVNQLVALVDEKSGEASRYIHFGATSQDIIDTAMMIRLKEATKILLEDLVLLMKDLKQLSLSHRLTVMAGRSFLQHARPISFGFKVAGWLDPLIRSVNSIRSLLEGSFVLQLGGAVGTLYQMRHGEAIVESMSTALGLEAPGRPWHTQRDRIATIASVYGILAGNLGKMAKDISLLSQTEIGELKESNEKGRGGSSTMPQKANPVNCISILANAERIPALVGVIFSCLVQDHERGTGPWHAEWETINEIVELTGGSLSRAIELIRGLTIDKGRMLQNLEISKGLIYAENISLALAPLIGRKQAQQLVKECCMTAESSDLHLEQVCASNPVIAKQIKKEDLKRLFDPYHSLGLTDRFIDKIAREIPDN